MLLHEAAKNAQAWLDGWHIEPIVVGFFGGLALLWLGWGVDPSALSAMLAAAVFFSPLWLPLFLFVTFWKIWIHYIRLLYSFKHPMTLLHVELPPEVTKSPLAMELFLIGLWNNGNETTFIQRIWKGQFMAVTTLELVSNEGRIGFYIHLRKNWKDFIEARLYGQYPEAKITEVEKDYVDEVGYSAATHDLWCTEYNKSEVHAMPIRSYVDYQLDKNTDTPEIQIDPLTNILEFLNSVGQGEYVWVQIVMRARKGDQWYGFYSKTDSFKENANKEIQKMVTNAAKRAESQIKGDDPKAQERKAQAYARGLTLLTQGEKDTVESIERSLGKQVFECGLRGMYIVRKDAKFDLSRINNLVRLWDPFRSQSGNKLNVTRGMSIFDYPWQDFANMRRNMIRKKMFFWYKMRAYFFVPYDQVPVMMTTEELASLWHFPNSAVKTPGLQRVPSRRAEAPTNLPTGLDLPR